MKNILQTKSNLLPRLFDIEYQENTLFLRSGETLNDARWGAWFGEIQEILRTGKYLYCIVDLSKCCWVDPLPLLSLSLSLIEYEQNSGNVSVILPPVPSAKSEAEFSPREKDQARLLKFLVREGFFKLLTCPDIIVPSAPAPKIISNRVINFGEIKWVQDENLSSIIESPIPLAFERSTCVLAAILDLSFQTATKEANHLDIIDTWVEKILFENIDPVINEEVPSWAQDNLRYRLMTFLRETLHNVFEHTDTQIAGLYVRYREGALGESHKNWIRLRKFIEREENNNKVPLMKSRNKAESFPNTRTGFFEVFLLDSGQGLCRGLKENTEKSNSNLVHQTMLDVFKRGVSKKKNRLSQYGGLHLIGELLTPNQDYFRVRDEDTWWATQLPLKDEQTKSERSERIALDAYGEKHGNGGIKGLGWTTRLSWLEAQDISAHNSPWFEFETSEDRKAVLCVFWVDNDSILDENCNTPIFDNRFPLYPAYKKVDVSLNISNRAIFYLPPPKLLKNNIQVKIADIFEKFKGIDDLSLVIGDIPSEEAVTYFAAINNAFKFIEPAFKAIKRVVLVTRALRVCVLTRDNVSVPLKINILSTKLYISAKGMKDNQDKLIHHSLHDYLFILRNHDGYRLRSLITEQSGDLEYLDFIAEDVIWSDDLVLQGYFDFPETLTNPMFRFIYSLSLQRLIGLFPRLNCKLEALDPLVHSLVSQFNAHTPPRPLLSGKYRGSQVIQIGSTKVSGHTQNAEKKDGVPVFHFFHHPSGKAKGYFLLPWIGPIEIQNIASEDIQFRRVGKTPIIARDGWKAYPLPRFKRSITQFNGKPTYASAYEKTPIESYLVWQDPSRTPIKIGHWSYGGHHEIIAINLLLAFNTELERITLDSGGSLARFTYANLFQVFDIREINIKSQYKPLFRKIKEDKYKNLLCIKEETEGSLLVYPSHPVTDHIIGLFLELLEHEVTVKIRKRVIAILPIRRHRSGSGLQVSGITLERLKLNAFANPPIIFFDDAIISGRTYEEIKRLLRSLGYSYIYSLILLDRQRLPSVDYLEKGDHVCYWRLDIPSLGSKAHCPLCHAIDRVKALSDCIVSKSHRNRIESWGESWKEIDPSTEWGDAGLRPIPFTFIKPGRRFAIERNPDGTYSQIGGEDQEIQLTNSAGLITWITELHTITSRDDLPFRVIDMEKDAMSSEIRIQLLASQLLLFQVEYNLEHAVDMGVALMQSLWDSSKHDRHTSLAALTLMSCGDLFLKSVIDRFMNSDRIYELKDKNLDVVLLIALMLSVARRNLIEVVDDSMYEVASRLLKPNGKVDLYYRLHREVKDALGKAHSSPLNRLITSSGSTVTYKYLMNIQGSTAQILAVTNEIKRYSLRTNTVSHKEFMSIKSSIYQKEEELRQRIKKYNYNYESNTSEFILDIKDKGKKLLREGNKLHNGIFYSLKIRHMKNGCSIAIYRLFKSLNLDLESNGNIVEFFPPGRDDTKQLVQKLAQKELKEIYIVWDAEIKEAILDILSNVRHVAISSKILNPWGYKPEQLDQTAHLWCKIRMSELFFTFVMQNKSRVKLDDIIKDTKNSHSHYVVDGIGGSVHYENKDGGMVETTVSIPYAHTLQKISARRNL